MLIQVLNGLQYSMLLFMLAIGMSIVFGLMNFINLAHGTLYMFGAFLGLTAIRLTGSFALSLLTGAVAAGILGALFYITLLKRLQGESPMKQVLVTFGLMFVGLDIVRMVWGEDPKSISPPPLLSGTVSILDVAYPTYRLFIIALGLSIFAALYFLIEHTRLGAVIRAGVDDQVMAGALGINIERAFFTVFCLGCALAGVAGVVAAPLLQIYPGMDVAIIIPTLVVVVVGGPGRLLGTLLGALLIGMAETFGVVFFPTFSSFVTYGLLAIVLITMPSGLLGSRRDT